MPYQSEQQGAGITEARATMVAYPWGRMDSGHSSRRGSVCAADQELLLLAAERHAVQWAAEVAHLRLLGQRLASMRTDSGSR